MKIAVFGAGGVGGYFGARLQEHSAQQGCDVSFIARGDHLRALQKQGLKVVSPQGDVNLPKVKAVSNPAEIGPVDVVLVAVKAWQLEAMCADIKPLLGPDTVVLPLLNGVDAPGILAAHLPTEAVLGGLCGIVAFLDGPGCIKHVGIEPIIKLGELDNQKTGRVARLVDACKKSNFNVVVPDDIQLALWTKFIFISPLSGVGSVTRATLGTLRETSSTLNMVRQAVEETIAVGQAHGVALQDTDIEKTLELLDKSPADGTTSMQRDIAAGRPSELEFQTGAVVRLGREVGVSTPVNEFLYHCLGPQEKLAREQLTS